MGILLVRLEMQLVLECGQGVVPADLAEEDVLVVVFEFHVRLELAACRGGELAFVALAYESRAWSQLLSSARDRCGRGLLRSGCLPAASAHYFSVRGFLMVMIGLGMIRWRIAVTKRNEEDEGDFDLLPFASTVIKPNGGRDRRSRHSDMLRGRLNQMIIHLVRHRPGMTLDFILSLLHCTD